MFEIGRALQEPVDFGPAQEGTDRAADWSGSVLGRLPKGTMVTGQGTRIVWVYKNRIAHTA